MAYISGKKDYFSSDLLTSERLRRFCLIGKMCFHGVAY